MRIAVIRFGRDAALGEEMRARSWAQLIAAAGHELLELRLLGRDRSPLRSLSPASIPRVIRGVSVPETLLWSRSSLDTWLESREIDLQIAVTTRAWAPNRQAPPAIIDLVDDLADSYRQRASIARSQREAAGWRTLARRHDRVQQAIIRSGAAVVAAGAGDAARLGVTWLPNLVVPSPRAPGPPSHDVLFFGNLAYSPNVEALRVLADAWPEVHERRPGTSLHVAGRYPQEDVRRMADEQGWSLEVDFENVEDLCSRALVGVAPLRTANGIQNKVLEGAACGLPQFYSEPVAVGFGTFQPGVTIRLGDFAKTITSVLDDSMELERLSVLARTTVLDHFTPDAWIPELARLIDRATER